jgi:hypothetical protein
MSQYISESISKGELSDARAKEALMMRTKNAEGERARELRHGEWIDHARQKLKMRRFSSPSFALLLIFGLLFAGSIFLFENVDILTGPLYGLKIIMTSLFAVTLGFILSVWWTTTARFDIINALNTLAAKPPKPFVIATEFLLGEYVHLLQSRLQRYGDHIAGLGFDATEFLDEKITIFEGIRERASLSIKGMPKELENLFISSLNITSDKLVDTAAQRQQRIQSKLRELSEESETS